MKATLSEPSLQELEAELHIHVVPGTEIMTDVGSHHFIKSKRNAIVLVPQPSRDHHDPLNWSPAWKFSAMASTSLATFVLILSPLAIAPIFPDLIVDFNSDIAGVVQFTGTTILVLGFANFLWIPLSNIYGRRFVLLSSLLVLIASHIWRAEAQSYSSFMGAAAIAGIGGASGEALQPLITTDVMFLHERGLYTTWYFSILYGSTMLGPIIQGSMAQAYGWRSFWWLNTGLCALAFVFVLIGFPETKYHRVYESGVQDTAPAFTTTEKLHASSHDSKLSADAASNDDQKAIPSPTSYTQNDSHLGKGRPSRSQWKLLQPETHPFRPFALGLYLPFKLFCFPIVVFATFIVSFSSTCYLMITFVQSQAFAVPPYSFDQQFIGFMKFASLIGALIGLFTAGPLSDWVSAKLTQRDNGIREPEMRLPTMIPYVIIMLVGNFVVAFGLQNDWDWRAIVIVGFGCAGIQIAALPAIASTYAIDSYKPAAGTIFITITINKNVYGYGVSKFITPWVMQSGYVPPFMTNMCLLFLWVCCGAIFWIWGKRFRTWTAESSIHRL